MIKSIVVGLLISFVVSSYMVMLALQHNPQGEFVSLDSNEYQLLPLLDLFLSWFLIFSLILFMLLLLAKLVQYVSNKIGKK